MTTLLERLQDSEATFTRDELYPIFEALADQYGFHRSKDLPPKGQMVETASLTVPGFEHLGVLIVRPRNGQDRMITIPNMVDRLLGDNFNPSQGTLTNMQLIALAKVVIVSPVGFVDDMLRSDSDDDLSAFFLGFAAEYAKWIRSRNDESSKKKSGRMTGREPVSSSDTSETSSQQTPDG